MSEPVMPRTARRSTWPWGAVLLSVASVAALLVPPLISIQTARLADAAERAERRAGGAYPTSDADLVQQERDVSGAAAVIATLRSWRGHEASEEEALARHPRLADAGLRFADVGDALRRDGFAGRWIEGDVAALPGINLPLVVHLTDGGGRLGIVRTVALGHVYLADPARGNVVVPLDRFAESWSGTAYAFPDPPPMPQAWR
ncbi:MAG: cysteine peptidase family C39 domain-containing protein [Trueperaceae bacterium]